METLSCLALYAEILWFTNDRIEDWWTGSGRFLIEACKTKEQLDEVWQDIEDSCYSANGDRLALPPSIEEHKRQSYLKYD